MANVVTTRTFPINNETMSQLLFILVIIGYGNIVLGIDTLDLPNIANCGDQVVLVCRSADDCTNTYTFSRDGVLIYNHVGPQYGINKTRYATSVSNHQVQLTISNLQHSDAGLFKCSCGFDQIISGQELQYECRAATSTATTDSSKKLHITVDRLYPSSTNMTTILNSTTSKVQGTFTCGSSPTLALHYKCTWVSTESLPDGYHGYNITVTTVTQAAPLTGSFKIVTPMSPNISKLMTMPNNRQVVHGVQDVQLNMQCVSTGGIPAPTLAWYKDSTSTTPLSRSNPSHAVEQQGGTFTVTLAYSFTPSRIDDMKTFLCRLFYPGATNEATPDPSPASAILFLDLKPGSPYVVQTEQAVSGGRMNLRCISTNGRPAANITWSYRFQTFTGKDTTSINLTSETYTVVSELQRSVSAMDNGQIATCMVSHSTLSASINGTVIVDVKFHASPGSTTISGNNPTPATESNNIRLNCTSGSSHPASTITWYNGSEVLPITAGYTRWPGDNSGMITSNILTITPTRYMDGDRVVCRSDNGYGIDSKYVNLDIRYSPLIQPLTNMTAVEGESDVSLICSASSKPPANFTWYKGNTVQASGTGTNNNSSVSYVITRVNRTDAGSYRCQASNNVGSSDSKIMYLIVKYPPTVTVSITLSAPFTVKCKAEGYPESYTYQDWVQVWPGYGRVGTIPFTGTNFTLTDVTYEKSGIYICSVSNGIAVYNTDVTYMVGSVKVLFKAPPVLTYPSPDGKNVPVAGRLGQNATIKIKYWSNVNDSIVQCYKIEGGSRSTTSSCSVTETDTEVNLPVYNTSVNETGVLATITVPILREEDFSDYDVVVTNSVQGESVLAITIVPHGPPATPNITGSFIITPGLVVVTVVPAFHGGSDQVLVVQISTDHTIWINYTYVNVGQDSQPTNVTLVRLKQNTLHFVRMIAYNMDGRSSFSTVVNFTTAEDLPKDSPSAALIGSTVGTTCALLVVAVVVLVVWRKKEAGWILSRKGDRRSLAKDQDNIESVTECAMYVSAGNVQQGTSEGDVYSTPQRKRRYDPSSNVYAMVSKTGKDGKKKKRPGRPTQGLPGIPQVAETNFDQTQNPSSNQPPRSMNVNDDGLIYVDLEFDSTAKYDVIHGLDEVTIYVEIDFTKTAQPMPDSDEDSTEKK